MNLIFSCCDTLVLSLEDKGKYNLISYRANLDTSFAFVVTQLYDQVQDAISSNRTVMWNFKLL